MIINKIQKKRSHPEAVGSNIFCFFNNKENFIFLAIVNRIEHCILKYTEKWKIID